MHKVFEYIQQRSEVNGRQYILTVERKIEKFKKSFKERFLCLASSVYNRFISIKESEYLFVEPLFDDLLSRVEKKASIISYPSRKYAKFILRRRYLSYYPILSTIYSLYKTDINLESKQAAKLISDVRTLLLNKNVKYIVLVNDSLFLERFLIFCARPLGIKTVCIQHGLFQSQSNINLVDGHYADFMFLWGDSQKEVYKRNGFDLTKLYLLGYPKNVLELNKQYSIKLRTVCLLGQPFEKYNLQLGKLKKNLFTQVYSLLKDHFKVVYKPHPGEKDKSFIPDEIELFNGSMEDAIKIFDGFVSLTSTALLDVTVNNKIAVQLLDENFSADDFRQLGIAYSISSNRINEFVQLLSQPLLPYASNGSSFIFSTDVSWRFVNLIHQLKKSDEDSVNR